MRTVYRPADGAGRNRAIGKLFKQLTAVMWTSQRSERSL